MQNDITISMKRRTCFPTLVYQFDIRDAEALNIRLFDALQLERGLDQDECAKSNDQRPRGWHSRTDLHKTEAFAALTEQVHAAADQVSTDLGYSRDFALRPSSMWSIINPPGTSNRAHVHPGCIWSGVYYIQAPEASGRIAFYDPRTANVMQRPRFQTDSPRPRHAWTRAHFKPVAGRMLIFPSWLYHSVDPNMSDGERAIVSFNLSQRKIDK